MKIHQGRVAREIIIRGINTKVGIGNGRARHIQRINYLLKVGGRAIRGDLIGENDERLDEGRKAKRTAYLTKGINKSHDQRSGHVNVNKRSETDLRTIKKKERSETDLRTIKKKERSETDLRTIKKKGRSKTDPRTIKKDDRKPI